MLKVYGINIIYSLTCPLPLKVYVLYTLLNMDNYGWPLKLYITIYNSFHYDVCYIFDFSCMATIEVGIMSDQIVKGTIINPTSR